MRILVAEDERDLNRILVKQLTARGWAADACFDGEEACAYAFSTEYDVIIMDVTMPKADGFAAVARLRAEGCETPVIFLTARDAVEDRVRGLDAGACDYVVKPFSFEELAARLRAAVRKSAGRTTNVYTVADLTMDVAAKTVTRAGDRIELSAKEFAMLEYLLRNCGKVLSREQIENNVWNYDYEGGSNIVDVYIRYLRMKIDRGRMPQLIHTVRGVGYVIRREDGV